MCFSGKHDKDHAAYTDKQLEDLMEYALVHTDVNNDGYVDYYEFTYSIPDTEATGTVYRDVDLEVLVEEMLKRRDTNNDGYIDYAEFKRD
ncbi:unnamed protein product [Plutella xylostella]|uniref:(diamondback moth) hypothetical protein n=1 Tax=Plutella xylostella TaxID=51655 RepID=A0A8S4EXA9_PLUXY|nr:unnamed protein product [Plutella xylostella]